MGKKKKDNGNHVSLLESVKFSGIVDGIAFYAEQQNIERTYKKAVKELEKNTEEYQIDKKKEELRARIKEKQQYEKDIIEHEKANFGKE